MRCSIVAILLLEPAHAGYISGVSSAAHRRRASPASMVIGEQASSIGPAQLIRKLKADLPQFPWLAEGAGNPSTTCRHRISDSFPLSPAESLAFQL